MAIWQQVKEAVIALGGKASNADIKKHIRSKNPEAKDNTINCTILTCCVNVQSRINWPENNKPRISLSQYDFLYSTGRGQVELYDVDQHGEWEIHKDENGSLIVREVSRVVTNEMSNDDQADQVSDDSNANLLFPFEAHLRDFIAKNISQVNIGGKPLRLYVDDNGIEGIEYRIPVGRIDILAVDENENFVVLELKLSRGIDTTVGQLLRYIGWLQSEYPDKKVSGIIVAENFDEKIKYAVKVVPHVTLFRYQINFSLSQESTFE
ncbi:endonuclease NucS domain-containing protein [Paenibacillus sp. MMS18-CY102]|uniref:endonuclease NucS domain-containing protein n=1 Tax=Paenibacillus sp. MMS18-CY102 TaxID=2682849 RepID=UPI00136530E4|nr:endonuclease NucS domain-containing protein [Paenibacillus sp. MMS18-CY102]MWC31024.1 DUF91 domain-containing protein [Paenibacillus sp. MMS18-CY102]